VLVLALKYGSELFKCLRASSEAGGQTSQPLWSGYPLEGVPLPFRATRAPQKMYSLGLPLTTAVAVQMNLMDEAVNISLSDANRFGRLAESIAHEGTRGVGPAKRKDLDRTIWIASTTLHSDKHERVNPTRGSKRRAGSSVE
jgi:hypothetical protein